jgi:hypothetical protein
MSKPNDANDQRLEDMLRDWGADNATATEAGRGRGWHSTPRRPWWYWVAAAALLTAVVGATTLANYTMLVGWGDGAGLHTSRSEQIETLRRRHQTEIARLKATKGRDIAERDKAIDDLNDQLDELEARHAQLFKRLSSGHSIIKPVHDDKREGMVQVLSKESSNVLAGKLVDSYARLQASKQSFADELARLNTKRIQAEKQLAAARARAEASRGVWQRIYLNTVAPKRTGIAARQTAQRERRMLDRYDGLRTTLPEALRVPVKDIVAMLDKLRTVKSDGHNALQASLTAAGLSAKIDKLLAAKGLTGPIRAWLIEAQLILAAPRAAD